MRIDERLLADAIARFRKAWERDADRTEGYTLQTHHDEHLRRRARAQRLLSEEHLPDLTENELREILKDTDALYVDRYTFRIDHLADQLAETRAGLSALIAAGEQGLTPGDLERVVRALPGVGIFTATELLMLRFPDRYWLYGPGLTLKVLEALKLDVKAQLPRGRKNDWHIYFALAEPMDQIAGALRDEGFSDVDYQFVDLSIWFLVNNPDSRLVALIGASAERKEQDDDWLVPARQILAHTGRVASWWSYNPDAEYLDRLRDSMPTYLYVSYGGDIAWRGHIVDLAGPGDEPIPSPWPDHTIPEERDRAVLPVSATGKDHDARMWLLLDRIESLPKSRSADDFQPIGEKYQKPGQNYFAFVYDRPVAIRPPFSTPISALAAYLEASGFHFPRHLVATYYLSLQTKPFVILSGLSGTGKTKLGQLFAEFISPPEEYELETIVEGEESADTFSLIVRPYMRKYGQVVIPVDSWQYFPEIDPGDKTRVRIRIGGQEESCQLARYPRPENPERGPIQLLFRGVVRTWVRDELQVGDVIEVKLAGTQDRQIYAFRKRDAKRRRVRVRRRHAVLIPVHADWTDHRGLLGFHHLLTGTYHVPEFLRLLLRAYTEREKGGRPYFVILDEMNLARVEHYFADILSVLESRRRGEDGRLQQDPFFLHDQSRCLLATGQEGPAEGFYAEDADHKTCTVSCEDCAFRELVEEPSRMGEYSYEAAAAGGFSPVCFVPPRLHIPCSVHFAGTVNVDETTFTFSPKVLDRANVIEFGDVDLDGYWAKGVNAEHGVPGEPAIVERFTHSYTYPFVTGRREEARTAPSLAAYREQLAALVRLLQPFHLHFGYRVADEIVVYMLNAADLGDPAFGLEVAFDHAILQKVLPRFHGSRARLWQPLLRLLAFCIDDPEDAEHRAEEWQARDVAAIAAEVKEDLRLSESAAKLLRMLRELQTEGFTSFT